MTSCTNAKVGHYLSGGLVACTVATEEQCKADAALKIGKTAAVQCADNNTLTADPTATFAAGDDCAACPAGKIKTGGAGTAGCTACATGCKTCSAANTCTHALAGYFLNSGVPAACTVATEAQCKTDAALKIGKTAAAQCADNNTLTADPTATFAASADCAACPAGKVANGAGST